MTSSCAWKFALKDKRSLICVPSDLATALGSPRPYAPSRKTYWSGRRLINFDCDFFCEKMKMDVFTADRAEKMNERCEKWWERKHESSTCSGNSYLARKPTSEVPGRKKTTLQSKLHTAMEATPTRPVHFVLGSQHWAAGVGLCFEKTNKDGLIYYSIWET